MSHASGSSLFTALMYHEQFQLLNTENKIVGKRDHFEGTAHCIVDFSLLRLQKYLQKGLLLLMEKREFPVSIWDQPWSIFRVSMKVIYELYIRASTSFVCAHCTVIFRSSFFQCK